MYPHLPLVVVTLLTFIAPLAMAADPAAAKPDGYSVKGIRAFLFYEELGRQDARDAADGKVELVNVIIGEGDIEAPSSTTIILVDMEGPTFVAETKGTLTLTATVGKRVLRREKVSLTKFYAKGFRLSVPIVVFGTGCGELHVAAELKTPTGKSVLNRTVPFHCVD